MGKRKLSDHIHKFKKVNLNTKAGQKEFWVFKCIKPACSHYVPLTLAEGALCECNRCGEPMIIGKEQMYGSHGKPMKFPHCAKCTRRKNVTPTDFQNISEFIQKKEED